MGLEAEMAKLRKIAKQAPTMLERQLAQAKLDELLMLKLKELPKMVADEDTAYDEVINDLAYIGHEYIESQQALSRFNEKIRQLRRIMGEDEEE